MHIVFGGVFNGKTAYVKEHYKPSFFIREHFEVDIPEGAVVAITNFTKLVEPYCQLDEVEAAQQMLEHIKRIAKHHQVICMCDDISRGVVPIDTKERQMRDILGRLYQQLFSQAQTVTQIWYGIAKKIK